MITTTRGEITILFNPEGGFWEIVGSPYDFAECLRSTARFERAQEIAAEMAASVQVNVVVSADGFTQYRLKELGLPNSWEPFLT